MPIEFEINFAFKRILGKRIAELERRLGSIGDGAFPSKVLLNGYSVADIDKEVDQILALAEEKNDAVPDSSTSDTSECSEGIILLSHSTNFS